MVRDFDPQPELNSMPEQWHGVDQYLGSPEFARMMQDEFPEDAAEWLDPVTRRHFLTLMGASLALAGAAGCNPSLKPASQKKILPYVKKPEANVTGVPLFFPTVYTQGGVGLGVLVKSHEGRPLKIEGNPSHPSSLGATGILAQASILGLYDPDRSRQVIQAGNPSTWDKAKAALIRIMEKAREDKGASLRIVSGAHSSPTLSSLVAELKTILPQVKWVQYEAICRDNALKGAKLAFGKYLNPIYDFTQANVIVSIDSDFMAASGAADVRYTHDAASRRKLRMSHDARRGDGISLDRLSRIYAVESAPTNTGASADHRLPLKPSQVESFVRELAKELGVAGAPPAGPLPESARTTIKYLVTDLKNSKGAAAVIAGDHLSAVGHALVHAINHAIGASGKAVTYSEPVQMGLNGPDADAVANSVESLKALTDEIKSGKVETILLLGVNPVLDAPVDLNFTNSFKQVKNKIHLGSHVDETALLCDWHIPEAHYLETWADARAHDGTVSIGQPLIAPIHGGRSVLDFIATLLNRESGDPYQLIREFWSKMHASKKLANVPADFEVFWHHSLERGVVPGTTFEKVATPEPKLSEEVTKSEAPRTVENEMEIAFRADPTLYDGRFANNGWLQELPKPITRLTWDNAAIVTPATAEKLGCGVDYSGWTRGNFPLTAGTGGENGRTEAQMIELTVAGKKVKIPVFVLPGAADDVVTLHLGHGRTQAGKVAAGAGFDVYPLRLSTSMWSIGGITPGQGAVRTGEKYLLACTQGQNAMEGRRPSRWGTVADVKREEDAIDHHAKHALSFADNPPVAGSEKDLIRANLPGTPEEIERLSKQYPGRYVNNLHKHGDGGDDHAHVHDERLVPLSLISDVEKNKLYRRWGMAIDLGACTGCTACVIACVAENNIPVVGKSEVIRGRIMHWIRVDRYFATTAEAGGTKKVAADARYDQLKANTAAVTTHFQPLPCQQCEKAPCELVCPVNATVHSSDGLNDMVYNRCVGTRYCANNCPYKVRRFNFLQYANYSENSLSLVNNPEVTVRTRGVMEKCTYCVQRIRAAEIEAEREHDNPNRPKDEKTGRPIIKEGEVRTACQAACPAQAIAFGDLNNDQYVVQGKSLGFSQVSRWKLEPTNYGLLSELNTMPRTSYLAAVKNPNPELVAALSASKGA